MSDITCTQKYINMFPNQIDNLPSQIDVDNALTKKSLRQALSIMDVGSKLSINDTNFIPSSSCTIDNNYQQFLKFDNNCKLNNSDNINNNFKKNINNGDNDNQEYPLNSCSINTNNETIFKKGVKDVALSLNSYNKNHLDSLKNEIEILFTKLNDVQNKIDFAKQDLKNKNDMLNNLNNQCSVEKKNNLINIQKKQELNYAYQNNNDSLLKKKIQHSIIASKLQNSQSTCNKKTSAPIFNLTKPTGTYAMDNFAFNKNQGAIVVNWPFWNGTNQQWKYTNLNQIRNTFSDNCLEIKDNNINGYPSIVQNKCLYTNDKNIKYQQWDYEPSTKQIHSVADPKQCLDSWGGTGKAGDRVALYPCHGNNNQKWESKLFNNNENLPDGSYQKSCVGCKISPSGYWLYDCSCYDGSGKLNQNNAFKAGDCKYNTIWNNNGTLQC